jgi:hypothetical protein
MAAGRLATLSGTPSASQPPLDRLPSSHSTLRLGLVVSAFVLLCAVIGGSAAAKTISNPCAKRVIADWYDDGRISKIYPLACYRLAIAGLPPDVLDYSNAKEEISRALAFAKQGKPDPGGDDPTPPTVSGGTDTTPGTGTTETDPTKTDTSGADTTGTDTDTSQTDTVTTDTSGPSAVPIPLVVLGGIAVLLLAAGSAGYLRRRMNGDEDGDGTPPASA